MLDEALPASDARPASPAPASSAEPGAIPLPASAALVLPAPAAGSRTSGELLAPAAFVAELELPAMAMALPITLGGAAVVAAPASGVLVLFAPAKVASFPPLLAAEVDVPGSSRTLTSLEELSSDF